MSKQIIIGKARQIGASWAQTKYNNSYIKYIRKENRKETIKRLFNI